VQVLERKQLLPAWPMLEQLLPCGKPQPSLIITGAQAGLDSVECRCKGL